MGSERARILIVDDEPQVCSLLKDSLSDRQFQCTITTDSLQAKRMLAVERFAVMVTDISMPEISGLDLLALARKLDPACKVILITGVSNTQYLANALAMGAYDYFAKPFDIDQLAESIRRAVSDENPSHLPARAAKAMQLESYLRQASLESIKALVHAVEAKDPYTRRHSEQVTHYATNLAVFLGLPPQSVESIRVAGLLHDIGKIGVPDHILTKPGPLSEAEFDHIRRHPALGAQILENISMFRAEARLVRHHHENWDGTGYPDGLAGQQIPLGARIINIADSMDAMLMARTYKQAYPVGKMLGELKKSAGSQFDPELVGIAVSWCDRNPAGIIVPQELLTATP